jgi:hypothetical protein
MPFWPSTTDLGNYLGGQDLTAQAAPAQQALDLAVSLVQNEAQQQIAQALGDVVTLSPTGPRPLWPTDPLSPTQPTSRSLFLPEYPVTNVTNVVWQGTAMAAGTFYWDATGELSRLDGGSWGNIPRSVVVTYDHGYATCPPALKAVVLQVAARILNNPEGRLEQSDQNYRFSLPAVFPLELSRTEIKIVSRYRPAVVG